MGDNKMSDVLKEWALSVKNMDNKSRHIDFSSEELRDWAMEEQGMANIVCRAKFEDDDAYIIHRERRANFLLKCSKLLSSNKKVV
jgi:hypothetical protein